MTWLRKRKHRLHPLPPEVIDAHREALAVKREAADRRPMFQELADNMIRRHRANGFGEKLEATFQGKGLL